MKSTLKILLSMMVLMMAINVNAGLGLWTSFGPDGGQINDIVADPVTPNVFYAASQGGVYKTTDGALTWFRINNGITINQVSALVHHRSLSDVVYVAGLSTVFKTTDAGLNWFNTHTGLPSNEVINNLSMSAIAPDTIYISTSTSGVYKTINGGVSWSPANTGLPSNIFAVRVSPTDANRVYAATQTGLFESTDGGTSWSDVSSGIVTPYVMNSTVTNVQFAGFAGEIYITTYFGLFKSSDDGMSFTHQVGPSGKYISVNPSNSNEIIISGIDGLWKTSDGGSNWMHILADFAGNASEVANSRTTVSFDPFDPTKKLVGTDSNGVYIKTTASTIWQPNNMGLNAETIRGLAIHPGIPSRIYAAVGDVFSPSFVHFISTNSGLTWSQSNSGLMGLNFRDIEVDPFTASSVASTNIYAVGRDVPVTTFTGTLSDGDGGIYKSTDGGVSWSTIDTGIPLSMGPPMSTQFGTVRDITLDLNSSVSGGPVQTLFVAGSGRFSSDGMGGFTKTAARIYKSTNAGISWVASDTGIAEPTGSSSFPFPAAVKIVIDPSDSNIMYAATFLVGYNPGDPIPNINNGIWKSTDAGNSWVHSSSGLPTISGAGSSHFNVLSLVIDPVTPSRLYASAHDPITFASQIYKSEDSGASWTLANSGIATSDVRDIAIDSSGVVYAAAAGNAGNPGGVYQSKDFGATWQSFSIGLDALVNVLQIKIDESGVNPILYAGTTQSVHSIEIVPDIDTDGVANTTEMAAPNAGDGNNDNMPDSEQNNVTSLPINPIDVNTFVKTASKGLTSYATIEVTPITGTCNKLEDVQSLNNADVPDDAHRSFDYGVIRFEIVDCQQANVTIIYHSATNFNDPNWALRIYAPQVSGTTDFQWQTYSATATGNQWNFNLTDGQFGDIRPNNGRILFQGGVGLFAESIFQNSFE